MHEYNIKAELFDTCFCANLAQEVKNPLPLLEVMQPFYQGGMEGTVYFKDKTKIKVYNSRLDACSIDHTGETDDLKLVFYNANDQEIALLAINYSQKKAVVIDKKDADGLAMLMSDVVNVSQEKPEERPLVVFNRTACLEEISDLKHRISQVLNGKDQLRLLCIDSDFSYPVDHEPVVFTLSIKIIYKDSDDKVGDYQIIVETDLTNLGNQMAGPDRNSEQKYSEYNFFQEGVYVNRPIMDLYGGAVLEAFSRYDDKDARETYPEIILQEQKMKPLKKLQHHHVVFLQQLLINGIPMGDIDGIPEREL